MKNMLTLFPGHTWCTLAGGDGGSGGPRKKQDNGSRDRSMPQALLIGLRVAEQEEPLMSPVPALVWWPWW
jgi:hypothetical protein